MNITITGKDLKATDAIKEYIEKKAERLVKYFGDEFEVNATIKTEGSEQVAQIDVKMGTDRFRAVTAHRDLYASIDKDIDILEGQIRKMKTKKDKQNMTESIRGKEELRQDYESKVIPQVPGNQSIPDFDYLFAFNNELFMKLYTALQ